MEQIVLPTNIIAAGSSKSGKSYLTKYLIKTWCKDKKFNVGLVFTGTKWNGEYTSFLPEKYVIDGFDQGILLAFLNTMKREDKRTQAEIDNGAKSQIPHTFVIFDDILSEMDLQNKQLKQFFSTARHYNISLFFTTQYIHQATPLMRNQAEYVFMFAHDNKKSVKALYESFGQTCDSERQFKKMLYEGTAEQYACIMYAKEERDRSKKFVPFKAPLNVPKLKFKF